MAKSDRKKKFEQLMLKIRTLDKFDDSIEALKKELSPAGYAKIKQILKQQHQKLSKELEAY